MADQAEVLRSHLKWCRDRIATNENVIKMYAKAAAAEDQRKDLEDENVHLREFVEAFDPKPPTTAKHFKF